jgi:hypothetical protein
LLSWQILLNAAIARLQETPVGTGQGQPEAQGPQGAQATRSDVANAFWSHRQAACNEMMLAFRSLVDAFMHMPDRPSPAEPAAHIDIM